MLEIFSKLDLKLQNSVFLNTNNIKKKKIKRRIKKKLIKSMDVVDDFFWITDDYYIFIYKPKNQFRCNFFYEELFTYSSGLILRALLKSSRAPRRSRVGHSIFFKFLIKKIKSLMWKTKKFIFIIKTFNSFNILKKNFFSKLNNKHIQFIFKIKKNYAYRNYKKVSYINKRIRKKYIVE